MLSLKLLSPIVLVMAVHHPLAAQTPTNQHELGRLLAAYREGRFLEKDFAKWQRLLDSKDEIRGEFGFSEKVYEREIALLCLERMTNQTFYDKGIHKIKVKEIFSYEDKKETYRFHIEEIEQDDIEVVKNLVKAWYSGYQFGKLHKGH